MYALVLSIEITQMPRDFFHITRTNVLPWSTYPLMQVGNVVETGAVNPFFNYFLAGVRQTIPVNINNLGIQHFSEMIFLTNLANGGMTTSMSVSDVARLGQDLAMHFCKYTRELIWEDIRAARYPEKPSRKKCLWLAEGEDNLNYWLSKLGSANDLLVFRVEVDEGITHDASDEHLMSDNMAYNEAIAMAECYWNGEISNPIAKEVLFEGRLRVLEHIS